MTRPYRAVVSAAVLALVLLSGTAAVAQDKAEKATMAKEGFVLDWLESYADATGKLVGLAEAVPADKFSFRPVPGVRTVSEVYMHVAVTNYLLPPFLGAERAPGIEGGFPEVSQMLEGITDKDKAIAKLKDSVTYATAAVVGLAEGDLDEKVSLFGGQMTKRRVLMIILGHVEEHLGQSIAYARSAGVTPPWSRGDG
jgi:uncharacterized damage-inducible protein DinB